MLAAAVAAAHAAGLTIAGHANDPQSCRIAACAGVDSLEHGMFLDAADVAAMAANGTVLVPTLSVWDDWLFYAREMGWPAARRTRAEDLRDASRAAMAGATRAGVAIAAGTDAGGGAVRHGRIAREIELLIDCGLAPVAALQAATREGAALLGEAGARHHRDRQADGSRAARPQSPRGPLRAPLGGCGLPGWSQGRVSVRRHVDGGLGSITPSGCWCADGDNYDLGELLPLYPDDILAASQLVAALAAWLHTALVGAVLAGKFGSVDARSSSGTPCEQG